MSFRGKNYILSLILTSINTGFSNKVFLTCDDQTCFTDTNAGGKSGPAKRAVSVYLVSIEVCSTLV